MRLDEALRANRGIGPGFHLLRHALSWTILTTHAWYAIRGTGTAVATGLVASPPMMTHSLNSVGVIKDLLRPSSFALVGIFFALSGFLITGSAIRTNNVKVFFANRALRLLPALSVEVTLSALVLGPLVTSFALRDYFRDYEFFRYFGNIVGHVSYLLPGVFTSNPWSDTVNATLWTLPAELWCYAIMLCLMLTGITGASRRLSLCVLALLVLAAGLTITYPASFAVRQGDTHFTRWYVLVMFLLGILSYANARYIPLNKLLFVGSVIAYYGLMISGTFEVFSGIPLTYCMIYIGMRSFPRMDRLMPVDLSYGIYLYGFPITQFFIYLLYPSVRSSGQTISFLAIYPFVLALTIAFSLTSWIYIEKPALSLRGHILREPRIKA